MRRELLTHLTNFIHRCAELDIDPQVLFDLAMNNYNFEVTGAEP